MKEASYETQQSPSFGGIPVFWWDETIPVFCWDWPDEARLADFAGQNARAEKDDRMEQADRSIENDPAYATLYFVA